MKYICLGYHEEQKWDTMSDDERNSFISQCFAYDDELRKTATWSAGRRSRARGMGPALAIGTAGWP